MKRIGNLFEAVADFGNLHAAYLRARKGKRHRRSVDRFSFGLETELLSLRREVLDGSWRPGELRAFEIRDPKPRTIHAAPFRDRVLHQALMGVMEPHFERWFDHDSYACRKGKGVDAALARAVTLSRKSKWVLRSDIGKCFSSVDHAVLKKLLDRKFKDRRLLALLFRIIDHGGENGRGLPIGNLTSQWLANLYLDKMDLFIRHESKPEGYCRYMDDFGLFGKDRETLMRMRDRLGSWLGKELRLRLNPRVTQIFSCASGWPFLGFRVLPTGMRLRRETWRRFRKRLGRRFHLYERGRLPVEDLVAATATTTSASAPPIRRTPAGRAPRTAPPRPRRPDPRPAPPAFARGRIASRCRGSSRRRTPGIVFVMKQQNC